jgi:hypothetical protein
LAKGGGSLKHTHSLGGREIKFNQSLRNSLNT